MLQRIELRCFELLSIGGIRSTVDVITAGTTGEANDGETSWTWRPVERLVLRERRYFTGVMISP